MAEITDGSVPVICYGRKRLYLYKPKCGIIARTVRLSRQECAKYSPTGWAEGKNEHGNEYVGCIGIKAMEAESSDVTGLCFSPSDKSYKTEMGKCVQAFFSSPLQGHVLTFMFSSRIIGVEGIGYSRWMCGQ